MRSKWLNRTIMIGPYLTLCTTEEEFAHVLKRLKIDEPIPFHAAAGSGATTHTIHDTRDGKTICIVTLNAKSTDPVAVAAMLAHEAYHVWESHLECIGETFAGSETTAYGIQNITYELFDEWMKRQGGTP